MASRAQTPRRRAATKARAVVDAADEVKVVVKVVVMGAGAVVAVAAVVTAQPRVHVIVLKPTENPSMQKQQAMCKQQPRGSIKMQPSQSNRQIVHCATQSAATAAAVVAANALKTLKQAMPVNAMRLDQKDAMSVVQSAIDVQTKAPELKHQHWARQTLRQ